MEKFKKKLPVVLLSVASTLLLVAVILLINGNRFSFTNSTKSSDTNKENTATIKTEVEEKEESPEEVKEEVKEKTQEEIKNTPSNNTSSKEVVEEKKEEPKDIANSEEEIVTYFENLKEGFNNNSNVDESLTSKLKTSFVSIVDFIFYGKEIKGYTFNQLTNNAKLKIVGIALVIDSKIDTYFPGYKETIKDKYTSIKASLVEKIKELAASLCENVGSDTCTQAMIDFASMKDSFGNTFDLLKDLFGTGTEKLSELYLNWRDK